MSNAIQRRSGRIRLLLIAAVTAAPMAAAYLVYYLWQPTALTNYGELVTPAPVAGSALAPMKGKWIFVMVDSGRCDDSCRGKLYVMRQIRLTQGKEMDRIERAWLIDDGVTPDAALATEYSGTHQVPAQGSPLLAQLAADSSARNHIYLVDPLGNLMMRYARNADPSRMKKDLSRLLKVSRIG